MCTKQVTPCVAKNWFEEYEITKKDNTKQKMYVGMSTWITNVWNFFLPLVLSDFAKTLYIKRVAPCVVTFNVQRRRNTRTTAFFIRLRTYILPARKPSAFMWTKILYESFSFFLFALMLSALVPSLSYLWVCSVDMFIFFLIV